jgi:SHS2 domain-containing protein
MQASGAARVSSDQSSEPVRGPRWEHFAHDADIGIRGWGSTPAEAFEQAAQALTAVVTHANVVPRSEVAVSCCAPDLELLFVEWLNAIIYEMAVRRMSFRQFAVQIEKGRLKGTLWGEPVDVARHAPAAEPKGATYTALKVAQGDLWSAACVVDV